jgi:hypothetical protein
VLIAIDGPRRARVTRGLGEPQYQRRGRSAGCDDLWESRQPSRLPLGGHRSRLAFADQCYNEQRGPSALEAESALPPLRSHFAPVLLNETGLTVRFDGIPLDPAQEILRDTQQDFAFWESGAHQGRLRIIEWRPGRHRALYLGADEKHFVDEESGSPIGGQFPYSAYITWEGLDPERVAVLGLEDMGP